MYDKSGLQKPTERQRKKTIAKIQKLLPKNPSEIICGTGPQHLEYCAMLGLVPTRLTTIVGCSDIRSSEENGYSIRLSDGQEVDSKIYTSLKDCQQAIWDILTNPENHNAIIICDPVVVNMDRSFPALNGALYKITSTETQHVTSLDPLT